MRQIYPAAAALDRPRLADLYRPPGPGRAAACWLRANMVASAGRRGHAGRPLRRPVRRGATSRCSPCSGPTPTSSWSARERPGPEGYRPVRPRTEGARWAWLRDGPRPFRADRRGHPQARPRPGQPAAGRAHRRTPARSSSPPRRRRPRGGRRRPADRGASSSPAGRAWTWRPRSARWPAAVTGRSSPRAARTC